MKHGSSMCQHGVTIYVKTSPGFSLVHHCGYMEFAKHTLKERRLPRLHWGRISLQVRSAHNWLYARK